MKSFYKRITRKFFKMPNIAIIFISFIIKFKNFFSKNLTWPMNQL